MSCLFVQGDAPVIRKRAISYIFVLFVFQVVAYAAQRATLALRKIHEQGNNEFDVGPLGWHIAGL